LDVERVFRVDERRRAADLLHLCNHLQRERGLARRLRTIDFHDTATRQAADAERNVQSERTGGDHLNVFDRLTCAEPHDRPFAELLFDLRERCSQGLALLGSHSSRAFLAFFHESSFAMMNGV
jgi:hypothetical protein